ncbi:MAG: DEAD/DEAH box helicase family protein [bacterium]|nr:DEAD/DEAH box helicase family protein [bacterium]
MNENVSSTLQEETKKKRLKSFPEEVKFRFSWRAYQERILGDFEKFAADDHFHVVAAPGSGKTVLGLEVVLRLNQPTLVLAPTLGIKNQWVARLHELFTPPDYVPDWISDDLKVLRLLNVSTYQALHAYGKKNSYSSLGNALKRAGIKTLVFDEAHHLRQEWWKALKEVKNSFKNPFVVALTATPPFDVPQHEWNRYIAICGEVDTEVSIPELVKEGNLCPHQDYVYLVGPSGKLREQLNLFKVHIASFLQDLALNREIINAVMQHRFFKDPENARSEILKNHGFFISMLIFIKHTYGVIPNGVLKVVRMSFKVLDTPPFDLYWGEILLQGILFDDRDSFRDSEIAVKLLESQLYSYKAIEKKRVFLMNTPKNSKLLRSAPAKLYGVGDILQLENNVQGVLLSMVVLTDYIRLEEFPKLEHESKPFTRLGVVPIFEHLRRLRLPGVKLGILTGSLVVIPAHALPHLENIAGEMGLPVGEIKSSELWHDPGFLIITTSGKTAARQVELITRLFSARFVNVVVGTTALLGEGWDAPTVNTLVLATTIGSYVSSNQMRGRAIRVNPELPDKAANIWHLACVGENTMGMEDFTENDLSLLQRRFRSFPGLSLNSEAIESGLERLELSQKDFSLKNMPLFNARMSQLAEDRDLLGDKWKKTLFNPDVTHFRMNSEVFFPAPQRNSSPISRYMYGLESKPGFGGWLSRFLAFFFDLGPKFRRYRQVKLTARIARALIVALSKQGVIKSPRELVTVSVIEGVSHIRAVAAGLNNREEAIFVNALQEIFNPTLLPRYILEMRSRIFCVPKILGENKGKASLFHDTFKDHVGFCSLHFTAHRQGGEMLMFAIQKYLSQKVQNETFSRMRWC